MKKLLSVLGAIGLVSASSSVAIACNKKEKEVEKIDLATLPIKELGEIEGSDYVVSIGDLVRAINTTIGNESMHLDQVDVQFDGDVSWSKATLKASNNSTLYKGSVELTYKFAKQLVVDTENNQDIDNARSILKKHNMVNEDFTWKETFKDTDEFSEGNVNYGKFDGKCLEGTEPELPESEATSSIETIFNELKVVFTDTKNLEHLDNKNKIVYFFSARANAGDKKVTLFLVKGIVVKSGEKTNYSFTTINRTTFDLKILGGSN
ncbi:lipoprotein [Spiroplasma tabanidicola]|uniref:Lipoprotein n=1 Tax=Spiroplasma tabanidicola TaxID=324079 RepID=A0A6I6CBL5_9MOLU|nr:lipoprotein [Spiroplasma tabanidicola]QGS51462.1 hypothetical protein STABA_v1c00950 [Spiroplasma tabanidicola]